MAHLEKWTVHDTCVQSHELRRWDSNTQSSDLHSEACHGRRSQDISAYTQTGAGIAQLVVHPTETILMWVQVPGAAGDLSTSRESTSSADSLMTRVQPPVQSHASASMHMLKSLPLAAMPLLPHTKILHPLIGVGSAALAAAVPYPSKAI